MKNYKTTFFGLASIGAYAIGYFFPQYKTFADGLVVLLVGAGFISAKDNNVTGGTREQ